MKSLSDPRAEAYVLTSLAESHSRLGQHPSARSCLRHSLKLRQEIGDEEGEVAALRNLAKIYIDLGDMSHALAALEEAGRKSEALEARAVSTALRTKSPDIAPVKVGEVSGERAQVAGARPEEAENRVGRLRWFRSYVSDERGRKFYYEYETPSMETVLEDARNAGLSLAPDVVTQVLEPDMFS